MAGKTGADAIGTALAHICRVILRYRAKIDAVIDAAQSAGAITGAQATIAHDFIASANATCIIFEAIAAYNSVSP